MNTYECGNKEQIELLSEKLLSRFEKLLGALSEISEQFDKKVYYIIPYSQEPKQKPKMAFISENEQVKVKVFTDRFSDKLNQLEQINNRLREIILGLEKF